jgi:RimJ/RimL family protein N-acetyltransferase
LRTLQNTGACRTPLEVRMIELRPIDDSAPRPHSPSDYENWGDFDPRAKDLDLERWLIVLHTSDGEVPIGDMSAHAVYYGPTPGSRALNIGISIVTEYRGLGHGADAQRRLAELLHARGVVRVEAQTDVTNIAEQRALAKAGFVFEGILRRAQGRADGIHDLQSWSHLSSD